MLEPDKNNVGWQGTEPKHSQANSRYDGRYQHIDDQANDDDDDDEVDWQNDIMPPHQAASTAPRKSSQIYYGLLQLVTAVSVVAQFMRFTFVPKYSTTARRRTARHNS